MGPYVLGMLSAYWVLNAKVAPKRYYILEVICALLIFVIGYVGVDTLSNFLPAKTYYVYRSIVRVIYGLCWSYLIPGFLMTDPIPYYCSACCCRSFLAWSIWLPMATISYSFYVWHLLI